MATDIDLTYLKRLDVPNLEVRQHNILDDSLDALGPSSFDLVCSRLMLFWYTCPRKAANWLGAVARENAQPAIPTCEFYL